jgi:hypothetical protein
VAGATLGSAVTADGTDPRGPARLANGLRPVKGENRCRFAA